MGAPLSGWPLTHGWAGLGSGGHGCSGSRGAPVPKILGKPHQQGSWGWGRGGGTRMLYPSRREWVVGWGSGGQGGAGGRQRWRPSPCLTPSRVWALQPEESVGLRAEGHPDSLKDNSSCSVMVRPSPPRPHHSPQAPVLFLVREGQWHLPVFLGLPLSLAQTVPPCPPAPPSSPFLSHTQHLLPAPPLMPSASETAMTPDPCSYLTYHPTLPLHPTRVWLPCLGS